MRQTYYWRKTGHRPEEENELTNLHNVGNFDVSIGYDLNGNIDNLTRKGRGAETTPDGVLDHRKTYSSFTLDDLTYTYNGNQLDVVDEASTIYQTTAYTQFLDVVNGQGQGKDYTYDPNGNLTSDINKSINDIDYNHLNKPTRIEYSNGDEIRYYYSADGMKLRQTVRTSSSVIKRSDYLGGIHYEDSDGDGTTEELEILFAQHEEGRYRPNGSEMIYEYNLTDHLGNTRITFGDTDGDGAPEILQENHYYPFGMAMTMSSTTSAAPPNDYLYNGKELQTELGLDLYDYGARMYDASIGRWNGVDALANKAYSWTPYRYGFDNPVQYLDPTGNLETDFYHNGKWIGTDGNPNNLIAFVEDTEKADEIEALSLEGKNYNSDIDFFNGYHDENFSILHKDIVANTAAVIISTNSVYDNEVQRVLDHDGNGGYQMTPEGEAFGPTAKYDGSLAEIDRPTPLGAVTIHSHPLGFDKETLVTYPINPSTRDLLSFIDREMNLIYGKPEGSSRISVAEVNGERIYNDTRVPFVDVYGGSINSSLLPRENRLFSVSMDNMVNAANAPKGKVYRKYLKKKG